MSRFAIVLLAVLAFWSLFPSSGVAQSGAPSPVPVAGFEGGHTHAGPHHAAPLRPLLEPFALPFMRRALLAGLLAGAICAWLGVLVVLGRMIFVGVALAEVALAGVAAAVFLEVPVLPLAVAITLLASLLIGLIPVRRGSFSAGERTAFSYLVGGALAIVLLSKSGAGEAEQLAIVQGSLLAVKWPRVGVLAAFGAGVAWFHRASFRRLVWIGFDATYAELLGTRVSWHRATFFVMLGAGISLTIQTCGVLLVFGYLILPPALALSLGLDLGGVLVAAQLMQAAATLSGLWIAYEADLPAGASIVLVMIGLFPFCPALRRHLERLRRGG